MNILLEFQLEGKYRWAEFVTPIYSSFAEGLFKADYFLKTHPEALKNPEVTLS